MRASIRVMLVIAFVLCRNPAAACSCAGWSDLDTIYERHPVVFIGRVISEDRHTIRNTLLMLSYRLGRKYSENDDLDSMVEYTFEVCASWKGTSGNRIVLHTGHGGGDCGIRLTEGAYYLIFSYVTPGKPNSMEVNICRPIIEVERVGKNWREIGSYTPPFIDLLDYLYVYHGSPSCEGRE